MKIQTDKTCYTEFGPRANQLGERLNVSAYGMMNDWGDNLHTTLALILRTRNARTTEQNQTTQPGRDDSRHLVASHIPGQEQPQDHRHVKDSSVHVEDGINGDPIGVPERTEETDTKLLPERTSDDIADTVCPISAIDSEEHDGDRDTRQNDTVDDEPIQYITLRMKGQ